MESNRKYTLTTMPSRCKKVKNPCKICLGNVTQKSGIQCEGVCRSWAHYKCLNFTPGKISDIKRGLIIVTCPCPDCKTDMPKEIVKDEPYSCTNAYCPANLPPKCVNARCPSNAPSAPPGHNSLLAGPQRMRPVPQFGPCTVDTCKSSRVSPTHQQFSSKDKNKSVSPSASCCSAGDKEKKKVECVTQTRTPCPPPPPCPPPLYLPQQYPMQQYPPPQYPPPQFQPPPCPPRQKCRQKNKEAAKKNTAAIKAMERMCSTMGQLTSQLNTLMDKMQQALTVPTCPPLPCPPQRPACNMPSTQTNTCSLTELPCCCPGGGQQNGNDEQSFSSSLSPPCCLQDTSTGCDSQPPCFCSSNPLRRDDFYSN